MSNENGSKLCDGINVYKKIDGKNELQMKAKRTKKGLYIDEERQENDSVLDDLFEAIEKTMQ